MMTTTITITKTTTWKEKHHHQQHQKQIYHHPGGTCNYRTAHHPHHRIFQVGVVHHHQHCRHRHQRYKKADQTKRLLQDQQLGQTWQHQCVCLESNVKIQVCLDIEFKQLGFIFKRSKSAVLHCNTPQLNDRHFCTAFGCCSRVFCSLA